MILGRLRVRGKLNFLLALPLAAVVLVAVPFVAVQAEDARSANATADAARNARQLGGLVWELQRERLLTAGFITSPTDDGVALRLQQQTVVDSVEDIGASLGSDASDEMVEALARVESLGNLRAGALERGVSLESVARTYHAIIGAVVDALRLAVQRTSDAEGTRQLTAIDALLRANEENALRGMALIAAATKPQVGLRILEDASAQAQMFTVRFVQQSDVEQARLVVLVDQGEAARRVEAMVDDLDTSPTAKPKLELVAGALAAVEAQSTLRRLVQDRVTREIADTAAKRAAEAEGAAWTVGLGTALLFLLVMTLAVVVSRSISQPLQRLTVAATTVADVARTELLRVADVEHADEQPPRVAAIDVSSGDEVGELATAFNRVQTTAAMLLERQLVTRRNVSLIFANVAQRTQNLVGRQLVVIDELERDEQNTALLTKLYRLDHLSTRLRRNAKNLLVVAGARDQNALATPMPLATALRSALAEIEDYQRVRIGPIPEATVAPRLGSDLVLVLAELVENATAFSPPGSAVEVRATVSDEDGCTVTVVDHGIGMTPQRLADENGRIVERERLDIAPTSVLGLFVVGRLSRRHGLAVELSETKGGGVTAALTIPASLVTAATALPGTLPAPAPVTGGRRQPLVPAQPLVIPEATSDGTFSWFTHTEDDEDEPAAAPSQPRALPPALPAGPPPAARPAAPAASAPPPVDRPAATAPAADARPALQRPLPPPLPAQASEIAARNGLIRRVPGAQLQAGLANHPDPTPPGAQARTSPEHDAATARDAFDAYQSGIARATEPRAPELRAVDSRVTDSRVADSPAVDPRAADSRAVPRALGRARPVSPAPPPVSPAPPSVPAPPSGPGATVRPGTSSGRCRERAGRGRDPTIRPGPAGARRSPRRDPAARRGDPLRAREVHARHWSRARAQSRTRPCRVRRVRGRTGPCRRGDQPLNREPKKEIHP